MSSSLRHEVDRLREEVHRLTVQIESSRPARLRVHDYVIESRERLGSLWQRLRTHARRVVLPGTTPRLPHDFDPTFAPYVVRPLRPPSGNRPRVLHFIANFFTGGSSQLVVDLIEHLGHAYDHCVVARDLPETPAYTGLHLRQVRRFASSRQARRLLRAYRPDLVHVHYVATRNDEYGLSDWRWYLPVFQALEGYGCRVIENVNIPVEPFYSDSVDCYVFVSEFLRREYGHHEYRNVTIYPGSDLNFFSKQPEGALAADCIGMVYRLDGDKVDGRAIEVFVEVVRRRPRTRVLIVGGGYFLDVYRERVAAAGLAEAFTFTGYVSYRALPRYLEQMSVFVAPVHAESFGQVTPFAMGMELPVAAYDVGALGEILNDPSVLATPDDSGRLADIIIGLLEDGERRLALGLANRVRAEGLFSVETMVARYEALYRAIVGGDAPEEFFDLSPVEEGAHQI
jgi:glycosyltransferase involved in cell wall biosynthesis